MRAIRLSHRTYTDRLRYSGLDQRGLERKDAFGFLALGHTPSGRFSGLLPPSPVSSVAQPRRGDGT